MCTYLRSIHNQKLKDLNHFDDWKIEELYDQAKKKINRFVLMETEVMQGSKRAVAELEQEVSKKPKIDEPKEQ